MTSDIHRLVEQSAIRMRAEYDRVRAWAALDPGTAGDQGEENWRHLLAAWLPSHYHVVTKGRILLRNGGTTGQFDVLVLNPEYPRGLLNSKLYIAEGVAAAFECKLTLRGHHLRKFQQIAADTQRKCGGRPDVCAESRTPYKDLNSPMTMGMLAHSHCWKGVRSTPEENVKRHLREGDLRFAKHPRESIDIVCVSDLGTWVSSKSVMAAPGMNAPTRYKNLIGEDGQVWTAFMESSNRVEEEGNRNAASDDLRRALPIGVCLRSLIEKLAWENGRLRGLARHLRGTTFAKHGRGEVRQWAITTLSEAVREVLASGAKARWGSWDEWAPGFMM